MVDQKYVRQFTSQSSDFLRFGIKDGKWVVASGKGRDIQRRDIFPLPVAREMAFEILRITGDYRRDNEGSGQVEQKLANQVTSSSEEAEKAVREILREAPENENIRKMKQVLTGQVNVLPGKSQDVEKFKEEVIDDIYNEFGEDWFTYGEFKEFWNREYDKSRPDKFLGKHKRTPWMVTAPIEEHRDDFDGRNNVVYRLSDFALEVMANNSDGKIASEDNPYYKSKVLQVQRG